MGPTTNKRRTNCTTTCTYNNFCERANKNEMWMIGMSNSQYIPCFCGFFFVFFAETLGVSRLGEARVDGMGSQGFFHTFIQLRTLPSVHNVKQKKAAHALSCDIYLLNMLILKKTW